MKNQKTLEIVDSLLCMGKDNTQFGCVLCTSNATFEEYFNASTVYSKWTNRKNLEVGIYAYLTEEEYQSIGIESDVILIDENGSSVYFWQA